VHREALLADDRDRLEVFDPMTAPRPFRPLKWTRSLAMRRSGQVLAGRSDQRDAHPWLADVVLIASSARR